MRPQADSDSDSDRGRPARPPASSASTSASASASGSSSSDVYALSLSSYSCADCASARPDTDTACLRPPWPTLLFIAEHPLYYPSPQAARRALAPSLSLLPSIPQPPWPAYPLSRYAWNPLTYRVMGAQSPTGHARHLISLLESQQSAALRCFCHAVNNSSTTSLQPANNPHP